MPYMSQVRTIVCVLVAITLMLTLLCGNALAATADSRRKIVIFDDPLTEEVFSLLEAADITVLYNLSLINALAVQLPPPPLPPLLDPALELLDDLGTVSDDVLTFIDPICPTTAPPPFQEYRWGMQQIEADLAHQQWPNASQTGAVTVAVLDTGLASHPELDGRTVQGYNAITGTGPTPDRHGHGTHMTGIILAKKDDLGVVGVAGVESKIVVAPVKVLDDGGTAYLSVVINGLQWVSNHGGIRLVNMSFGFAFSKQSDGTPLMQAIQKLSTAGIVMVASAGNACCAGGVCDEGGGDDCGPGAHCTSSGASMTAPAAYRQVIAVGATNFDGQIANYSTYSGQGPEVLAPGGAPLPGVQDDGEILSTNNVGYGRGHGTSQAAAHVTGAIALAWSLEPGLSAQEVRDHATQDAVLNVQNMINAVLP